MRKSKVGLYIKLLGLGAFLTACDILLVLPSGIDKLIPFVALIVLLAIIGALSFLLVREIRRSGEISIETEEEFISRLRRSIGWGIFHLLWLTAGAVILFWAKFALRLPDPSVAGTIIPFAVFAGIVILAIVAMLVRIVVNIGRIKRVKEQKSD